MSRRPTDIVSIQVRMREGLRKKIEKAAQKNDQSNNAEMVTRLEASFDEEEREGDFRAAIATLTGGEANARLISMLASALNRVTTSLSNFPTDYAEDHDEEINRVNMEAFRIAADVIVCAVGGFTIEPKNLGEMPPIEEEGVLAADSVLKHYKLPRPLLDKLPLPPPLVKQIPDASQDRSLGNKKREPHD